MDIRHAFAFKPKNLAALCSCGNLHRNFIPQSQDTDLAPQRRRQLRRKLRHLARLRAFRALLRAGNVGVHAAERCVPT